MLNDETINTGLTAPLAALTAERDRLAVALARAEHEARAARERLAQEHEELRVANSLLAATLDSTADGILVADGSGGIASFNARFADMWRIPEEILVSRDDERALGWVLEQLVDPVAFLAKVHDLYAQPEATSHDVLEFKDGRVFERLSRPQRLDGAVVGRVWSFRDVTARRRLEEELRRRADHDTLTGLANREVLVERVRQALTRSRATGTRVIVAVLDLDGFKNVNDRFGHSAGDELLVRVADRLVAALDDGCTIARLGGDEFAVLLPDLPAAAAVRSVGQRLLTALEGSETIAGRDVLAGASIGLAEAAAGTGTPEELLRQADTAMYAAKAGGKRAYRLFEQAMHDALLEHLEIAHALRTAIASDAITVAYQPIVDAATDGVVALEALARWDDPTRGTMPPALFVPIAEESDLIARLGESVLRQACHQLATWRTAFPGLDLRVSVNVSRRQLTGTGFSDLVAAILHAEELAGECLMLEITESAIGVDRAGAEAAVLAALRARGVTIAIDDFGTGYSSLAALVRLPVDALKIDRRFVEDLTDPRGGAVVEAIVQIARTLGLSTIAEGVETAEQLDRLRTLGCARLQGYLYARPLTTDAATTYLADHAAHRAA